MKTINLPAYYSTSERAAFYVRSDPGSLRISGDDRIEYLQRQTTNDLRFLSPQQAVLSVLTSPNARILDVLYMVQEGGNDEAILALTLPGYSPRTYRFFKERIFFMDKVSILEVSAEFVQVDLLGPEASDVLENMGITEPLSADKYTRVVINGDVMYIMRGNPALHLGYFLLVPVHARDGFQKMMSDAGILSIDEDVYTVKRVEAGLPVGGSELVEDYTPLEVGLSSIVSASKGCYTGQEVLARQVTYDKITQELCGIRLDSPALIGHQVWSEGRLVGVITSMAGSPRFGWIALAVIRRPANQPGACVFVGEKNEQAIGGKVVSLPFTD
jgi:folate-binding protein YgfZ